MYEDYRGYETGPSAPPQPPRKKGGGAVKKAAGIIAAAILFGTVSGAVMVGINMAGVALLPPVPAVVRSTENTEAPSDDSQGGTQPDTGTPEMNQSQTPAPGTDVSAIVEEAMPSVVAITSTVEYESNDPYSWFFGGGGSQVYEVPSSGSGIIVGENDKELLIVTNNHVIEASKDMKVAFIDDSVVEAAVKGTDADADLAVIAVPLKNISPDTMSKINIAKLGDSDKLKVGQGVVAIGNALGYGQSVTVGYVSALNREVRVSQNSTRTLLQTDAAINPGNSGGALLNMQGEVIGINAAKYSSTDVEGIGYAIPISKAQGIIGDLMNKKTRNVVAGEKRGYLGIQGTSVDQETSRTLGMPEGVYVFKILENGAASGSGINEKDIITKFDGQSVKTMGDLQGLLACYEVGDQVELTVQHLEDGKYVEQKVAITLAPMPESAAEPGN